MDERELLREYVESRSERAFAELVRRHLDMVYSTTMRVLGDTALAEETTQSVFVCLAKKAATIRQADALGGWLYRVARCQAANVLRAERARRQRENEAVNRALLDSSGAKQWEALAPELEEAMEGLPRADQDALVLRFFQGRSLRDVGLALHVSEAAAAKRVSRAVEKLRLRFVRRGLPVSASALAVLLAANSLQAAPAGLAATSLAAGWTAASASSFWTFTVPLIMSKTKATLAAATLLAVATTPVVLQHQANASLSQENARLRATAQAALPELGALPPRRRVVTNVVSKPFNWQSIESPDYRKYIVNLRAIGCPEKTIRDIIIADVDALFSTRHPPPAKPARKLEYWKASVDAAAQAAAGLPQPPSEEKRALLQELIGAAPDAEPPAGWDMSRTQELLLEDFLEPAKKARVLELMRKPATTQANSAADEAEDIRDFYQRALDLEAELAQILTPQEQQDYQLRMTTLAMMLRYGLADFQPTEQEFQGIFGIHKGYWDELAKAGQGPRVPVERLGMISDQREVQVALKNLLGEQRYAQYEQSRKPANDHQAN